MSAVFDGVLPDPAFWRGRKVLVTGHTGFKGAWATAWLSRMGAHVTGFSLPPQTEPALFGLMGRMGTLDSRMGDLRDPAAIDAALLGAQPEIVLHMAAQAIVRRSYTNPVETWSSNVLGLVHLFEAVRKAPTVKVCLVTTTDKVYENLEDGRPFREGDPLGGHDPYSASKAAGELVCSSYRRSFLDVAGVRVATARAGNVIGGGDFSPDRLVPDIWRSLEKGEAVRLRYPQAERPWQHVLDCLCGYFVYAERLHARSDVPIALNFGPDTDEPTRSVREIAERMQSALGAKGGLEAQSGPQPREMDRLALDTTLAKSSLGWAPRWRMEDTIARTAGWYAGFHVGKSAHDLVGADLDAYLVAS